MLEVQLCSGSQVLETSDGNKLRTPKIFNLDVDWAPAIAKENFSSRFTNPLPSSL